jgi:hypothetical protein
LVLGSDRPESLAIDDIYWYNKNSQLDWFKEL